MKRYNNATNVYMYDRITLEFVHKYRSVVEFCDDNFLSKSEVYRRIERGGGTYCTLDFIATLKDCGDKIKVGDLSE